MEKIITNKIRCKKCGDIIESTHRHDFKFVNVERWLSMVARTIYGVVGIMKSGKS